jgi:putative chitinase
LTPDGVVGPNTWAKIFAPKSEAAPTPAPAPVAQPIVQNTTFNLGKLKGHIPQAVIDQIPDTAARFGITTTLRLAHFLAQCGHESGGFKAVSENLNYGAKGLLNIFKKYFKTIAQATAYERKPEKIANLVYANRMGNGNEASGEGFKFRGRGFIQLTGKENYKSFDATVPEDIIAQPELVATKYPLASAAFFFKKNNLWSICDKGNSPEVVTLVTKRVNGGTIGLADRQKHFKEYYNLLS